MEHRLALVLPATKIIGQCRRQLVGMTMLSDARRKIRRLQHNAAERDEQFLDGTEHLRLHQLVATRRLQHGGIDNMFRTILAHHLGHHLNDVNTSHQANLHHLWLQVVEDSLNLLTDNSGRQVIELLDTQRVLYGDRGDNRGSRAAKLADTAYISLNARAACSVGTSNS